LAVNAGAILEDDDQDGLAHFCEHMAFNGTNNYEKKQVINYLQRIGMKFGPEINAGTTQDYTQYMLQKVPIDVKENIDTSLNILYEWACNVAYEESEIDNERGVIHEEWRTRRSAQFRMQLKNNKVIYKDSKYAERDVIGKLDVIDNCKYDALKRFYKDWYRPDLQAIIAVGDFDVKEMEQKIIAKFSTIPKPVNPKKREEFQIPNHKETRIAIAQDKEAQYSLVSMYYKHDLPENKDMKYYKESVLNQIYGVMFNARLAELSLDPEASFIQGFSFYGNVCRTKDAYVSIGVAKNNMVNECLKTLLIENEKVKQFGFNESELERAKKQYFSSIEKVYNERDKRKSASFCNEYSNHFLNKEPVPGLEYDYKFIKEYLPSVKVEDINTLAKKWIIDENRVAVITAPENVSVPTEKEVMQIIESIKSEKIEPYVDKVIEKPLFSLDVTPSKIVDTNENKKLETTEWTLGNGIKVVIKSTDFKQDEILMTAYSEGGYSLHEDKDDISADFAADVVNYGGISEFNLTDLTKILSDKNVNVSPYISELQEGFRGNSTPADFETMLQLLHLYFVKPKISKEGFESYLTLINGFIENQSNNPTSALFDTVQAITSDYSIRERPLNKEILKEADFMRIRYIYKQRFGDPSSFTFYFVGNINTEEIKPMIEKYLGGLPTVKRVEKWKDLNIRTPKGKIEKEIFLEMAVPKSTVFVRFHGDFEYNLKNRLILDAIENILFTRYTETIREEQGGSYGVGVNVSKEHYPAEQFTLSINFDTDPERVSIMKAIVYDEISKIKKEGPELKHLDEFKTNKLKEHAELLKENRYWLNILKHNKFHNENLLEDSSYNDIVNSITVDDIKNAFNKYLDSENVIDVVLSPKTK
jgi:zinc protease